MKVNITQYGLRPFRITEMKTTQIGTVKDPIEMVQYKGEDKLPKGTTRADGKKWMDLDYWFLKEDIKNKYYEKRRNRNVDR